MLVQTVNYCSHDDSIRKQIFKCKIFSTAFSAVLYKIVYIYVLEVGQTQLM